MQNPTARGEAPSFGANGSVTQDERFDLLYRTFHPRLLALCRRLTADPAAAEDITQETLLRALIRLDELEVATAWPWLRTVAGNLVIDRARRRIREVLVSEDRRLVVIDGMGNREERMVVSEALSTLPSRQRMAVRLRYLEGWESREVAAALGVGPGALKQVLFRARRKLAVEYRRLSGELVGVMLFPLYELKRLLRRARSGASRMARAVSWSPAPSLALTTMACAALVAAGSMQQAAAHPMAGAAVTSAPLPAASTSLQVAPPRAAPVTAVDPTTLASMRLKHALALCGLSTDVEASAKVLRAAGISCSKVLEASGLDLSAVPDQLASLLRQLGVVAPQAVNTVTGFATGCGRSIHSKAAATGAPCAHTLPDTASATAAQKVSETEKILSDAQEDVEKATDDKDSTA